jgi:hypothetical protein
MKKPFGVYFTSDRGLSGHAEMHWRKDSKVIVNLRLKPHLNFTRYELIFGFDGDESSRPVPIKAVNTFIKIGNRREQSPGKTDGHGIDYRDHYHIKETVETTKGNVYSLGFEIKTRKPGRYPIHLEMITDGGHSEFPERLYFVVEDR